jgi:zinc transport system substrate-binding protein
MKKTMRIMGLGVCILAFLLGGCAYLAKKTDKKLVIVTTLFPQYDFAKQLGKDKVEVILLLPPGVEAHHYEPTPRDIAAIQHAKLFVYTNAVMEPWAKKLTAALPKTVVSVNLGKGVPFLKSTHHDDDEHSGGDPHIWLNPVNAQIMVKTLSAAMIKQDPNNAEFYSKNTLEYLRKLDDLDADISKQLSNLTHHTLLSGGHFAFAYFAKRYALTFESPYHGFSPDAEPTPRDITKIIQSLKKTHQDTIFYEELVNPAVAELIAKQTGAKLSLLHAAHNVGKDELASGITYIDIMTQNTSRIRTALAQPQKL